MPLGTNGNQFAVNRILSSFKGIFYIFWGNLWKTCRIPPKFHRKITEIQKLTSRCNNIIADFLVAIYY